MQQASLATERVNLLGHRGAERLGTILLGNEGQTGDELLEELVGNGVVSELLAGFVCLLAEGLGVEFVE